MPRYRIHVESLDPASPPADALTFEVTNHDDILAIARRARNREGLEQDEATALAIGLKLFSEVVLKHRKEEPYSSLQPHLREFILAFKSANTAANASAKE